MKKLPEIKIQDINKCVGSISRNKTIKEMLCKQLKLIGFNDEQIKELELLGIYAMENAVKLIKIGINFDDCIKYLKKTIEIKEKFNNDIFPLMQELSKIGKKDVKKLGDSVEELKNMIDLFK